QQVERRSSNILLASLFGIGNILPNVARSSTAPDSALLERLGARVRTERHARALSRRELAEKAGLSERFLAMLESGRAKVSVTRLAELARALDTTAADLLASAPPPRAGRRRRSPGRAPRA